MLFGAPPQALVFSVAARPSLQISLPQATRWRSLPPVIGGRPRTSGVLSGGGGKRLSSLLLRQPPPPPPPLLPAPPSSPSPRHKKKQKTPKDFGHIKPPT